MTLNTYTTDIPGASHWSLRVRKGTLMRLTDLVGDANVGMLFYNPENLLERYNAPDTLKCQHTFKLTRGNCLYSDMGRIFASIVEDDLGWHESVCGNSNAASTRLENTKRPDFAQATNMAAGVYKASCGKVARCAIRAGAVRERSSSALGSTAEHGFRTAAPLVTGARTWPHKAAAMPPSNDGRAMSAAGDGDWLWVEAGTERNSSSSSPFL